MADVHKDKGVSNGMNEPLTIVSSGKTAERVVLFTIDDKEFTVPAKPGPNITLKFMDELRRSGNEMFASLGLLEAMLGPASYRDLLDYDELTDELLGKILDQVVTLAMTQSEEIVGK